MCALPSAAWHDTSLLGPIAKCVEDPSEIQHEVPAQMPVGCLKGREAEKFLLGIFSNVLRCEEHNQGHGSKFNWLDVDEYTGQ